MRSLQSHRRGEDRVVPGRGARPGRLTVLGGGMLVLVSALLSAGTAGAMPFLAKTDFDMSFDEGWMLSHEKGTLDTTGAIQLVSQLLNKLPAMHLMSGSGAREESDTDVLLFKVVNRPDGHVDIVVIPFPTFTIPAPALHQPIETKASAP